MCYHHDAFLEVDNYNTNTRCVLKVFGDTKPVAYSYPTFCDYYTNTRDVLNF